MKNRREIVEFSYNAEQWSYFKKYGKKFEIDNNFFKLSYATAFAENVAAICTSIYLTKKFISAEPETRQTKKCKKLYIYITAGRSSSVNVLAMRGSLQQRKMNSKSIMT